jgi:acyl-CoA thioester hydrolase
MTDMADIMHFSNYFRMMEVTEHAFFRSLGFSINTTIEGREYGWPRVHVSCDYKSALRFEDEVEVQMVLTEKRSKALSYQFTFRKGETVVAVGKMTVVCVAMDREDGKMKAVNIPEPLAVLLTVED